MTAMSLKALMNFRYKMKNKFKNLLSIILPGIFAAFISPNVMCCDIVECGRISDYTYEDGKSNIIVANRDAGKILALTFDDGPSERYTAEILDILSEYNTKATFFVIGKNAEKHPDLVKRIVTENHELGNHTYSHPQMRNITSEDLNNEIKSTQKILTEITGITPKLFRPPGGYLNNIIMEQISANGCTTVLWSWRQDTMDWKNPPVNDVIDTVLKNVQNGDIILFHDYVYGESPTPDALRVIIPKLKDMGYDFVTVSELAEK